MQVILKSNGIGPRLHPYNIDKPKCFLKINGKPIIDYQYKNLKKYNLHKKLLIISNKNHVSYFKTYFRKKKYKPKIISEKPGLGLGGSLIQNKKFIEKKFILIYSDIFFNINFFQFINRYKNENKIFCHKTTHKFDNNIIITNGNNLIKKIIKKKSKEKKLSNISISGIYFLKKNFLEKSNKLKIDLVDLIKKKLNNTKFFSYFSNEQFSDFGTFKRYKSLKKRFNLKNENKAIIFDRDGTIISEKIYVNSPKKIRVFQQFYNLVKKIKKKKIILLCITNQSGIAKGFLSEKKLEKIHLELNKKIQRATGTFFDRFYHCPHYPISSFKGKMKKYCKCRKPKSGLFLKAIKDFNLEKKNIINIGNVENDMYAGYNAGIKKNYLISNKKKKISYTRKYIELNYNQLISRIK